MINHHPRFKVRNLSFADSLIPVLWSNSPNCFTYVYNSSEVFNYSKGMMIHNSSFDCHVRFLTRSLGGHNINDYWKLQPSSLILTSNLKPHSINRWLIIFLNHNVLCSYQITWFVVTTFYRRSYLTRGAF